MQSWLRTKDKRFWRFQKGHGFAFQIVQTIPYSQMIKGIIAFWYGNFCSKAGEKIWLESGRSMELLGYRWKVYITMDELIHVYNPSRVDSKLYFYPFTVSGSSSPKKFTESGGENYPAYMPPVPEKLHGLSMPTLTKLSNHHYDDKDDNRKSWHSHYLSAFEVLFHHLFMRLWI